MLTRLQLKCFRQHEEAEFTFGEGLTIIRGHNEAGKTSLILALLYALGGATALPDSLDETVTWGQPAAALKVVATLDLDGITYVFSRSAAGAECNYDGHKVVGQKEVTRFAAELLGADIKTAQRLLLARQKGLSAALDEGPTALSAQIEALANFDLFDTILQRLAARRVTGPTTLLEDRLAALQTRLGALTLAPPDTGPLDAQIASLAAEAAAVDRTLRADLEPALQAASDALAGLQERQRWRQTLAEAAENERRKVARRVSAIAIAEQKANQPVDLDKLTVAELTLADALDSERRRKLHAEVTALMATYPAHFWEGTEEELVGALANLQARCGHLNAERVRLQGELNTLAAQRVSSSVCGLCGEDVSQFPEVARKNAAIDAAEAETRVALAALAQEHARANAEVQALVAVTKAARAFAAFAVVPELMRRDLTVVPCRIVWTAPVPDRGPLDTAALRAEIAQMRAARDEAAQARDELARLRRLLAEEDQPAWEAAQAKLAEVPEVDAAQAEAARQRASAALQAAKLRAAGLEAAHRKLVGEKHELEAAYARTAALADDLRSQIAQVRGDLKRQVLANALLKKVRAARPIVADQLWNTVLSAVSVMLTQMRGQISTVTKDRDGFKINGRSATGLSGSAQDLLGLAIRVALMKTFLPHVSMLVLDEPAAAADDDRTAALLGFIASAGFKQTILITHESVSEAMADHLIQL